MKLKQFIFALVAMLSSFAFTANAQTAVSSFDELKAALANSTDIVVNGDIAVDEAITIPSGTTVAGDGTLRVQTKVYVVSTENPYPGVTYNKTATKNGLISGTASCAVVYEISLDGGENWFTDTTDGKAQAVTVKKDGTKTISTSFQSAFTSAKCGEVVHMLKDAHVQSTNPKSNNGPLRSYYGLILEGNGHTIYTDVESSGASNDYSTIKFTSNLAGTGADVRPVLKNVTIDSQKNAKADLDIVSGDVTFTVSLFNVNLLGKCVYASIAITSPSLVLNKSNVKLFDSSIPKWDAGSANAIEFYSGDYSLSFNGKCKVYGGSFSKDATKYLADRAEMSTVNGKYVVTCKEEKVEAAPSVGTAVEGEVANEIVANEAVANNSVELPADVANFTVQLTAVESENEATTKVTFTVTPSNVLGEKVSTPTEAITFRLPVPAAWSGKAKVYNNGAELGVYDINEENGAKYVEVTSANFSEFAVELFSPVAKIGNVEYGSLSAAFAAVTDDNQTVVICKDVTENLTGTCLRGNITTENGAKVTITLTNSDWVYCQYTFVLGENITLNVPALFYYAGGSVINGKVIAGAYYQRYAGTKLTINEPGSMTVTSETCIIRYMDGDPNAGIYVVGDNDPSTIGLNLAVAYFYQGMINAKDANIVAGTYWQTNETDGQGSANLVLDNSTLTVTVSDHPAKATGNSTVTLTNGSELDAKNGGFTYNDAAKVSVDATSKIIGKNGAPVELPVAQIESAKYLTLQAAVNAVQNGETITLIADVEENVTVTEKAGLYYTIDGDGKKMNGTITVSSLSDTNDNRRITIKNINFVTTEGRDFITSTATNHYPRITVEGCSFIGTGKEAANSVAIRLKSSHSVIIKDCTGTGLHSFLQNTSGWNLTIENVKVTDSKSGFALGTVQGVTVKGCTADVDGYGIRMDAGYNNNAVIESNTIKAFIPVVVRKATVDSNITVKGENTMTATNEDGLWMAIGTSEYEANGTMPTAATGKVKVAFNETNLTAAGVYGNFVPVAAIGEVEYTSLEDAFKAATSGCTIEILSDVTVDSKWDCRYTGAKFTVPVTINGNGKTIKFTGSVNDNNWNTVFRFEENAAVNNLTVDISSATGAQRVISAKKSLAVDGLNIIGEARYGVIYGEGASAADLAATEIVVKNSTLGGTRRALSDNEGGKDVKSVEITGNTFKANVYVSASESIAFNNNTVAGETDLRSYAADNVLDVQAQGNTLTAGKKNYIYAKTIEAQTEFATKNPPLKVATKDELQAALAAAKEGDVIILTADIDYGTDQLAITKAITLDLGGKTLTTRNAFGGMSIKGNPTVKNGNIVHASNTAAIKVWNATAFEDLVIDVQGKGDANKTIGGIVLQSGNTTKVGSIKNVTIKGAALTNGIETYNCGDTTENVIGAMENVTIDAQGTGLLISAPCGTATNCDIKGGVNAVEIFIKGNYSASLELVASTVEGGVYAHDEFSSNPDIVNNGTIKFTADDATTGASAADVTLEIARAKSEKVQGVLNDVMVNAKAKLNNVYYATFAEALAAAKAGDTLTLLADLNMSEILVINKAITLDGNGKKLTSTAGRAINVDCEGNVGIKNLTINASGERAINVITKPANVTIENVIATAANYTVNVAASAGAAKVAINNSNLTGLNVVNVTAQGAEVTINGGTITCNDQTDAENYAALNLTKEAKNGKITATGVTFDIKGDSKKASNGAEGGVITIDGETDEVDVIVAVITYEGSDNYNSFATLEDAIEFAKAGETITLLRDVKASDIITINKAITLNGNGKTLTSTAGRAINIETEGKVVINNLTVKAAERAFNIINKAATVELNDVTATANNNAVMIATSAGAANVTINGCDFTGLAVVNVAGAGAQVAINDTEITNVDANDAENYGAITVYSTATNAKVTVTGGSITVADDSKKAYIFAEGATVTGVDQIGQIVAMIGEAGYETLTKAIADAKEGQTVKMVYDVALSEILVINKAITLDGNGKKLTSTADRAINVSGAEANGVKIQNLTINASGERAINVIQNATNVTIENVTATADNYTVNVASSAPKAVVTIKGSNLTGLNVVNVASPEANVTIEGGKITCNDQNDAENYAALALNKDAKDATITATGVDFVINGDSKKAKNGAEGGVITIDGKTDDVVVNVAYIDNGGNYYYAYSSIEAAIKAAKTGETITLLRDVTVDEWKMFATNLTTSDGSIITHDINGITIDGNGHTLTINDIVSPEREAYLFYDATELNVKDLTISYVGEDEFDGGIGLKKGTIENVTFNGGKYGVLPGANGVTVTGCTFNGTTGYAIYYEEAREGIVVTDNTFNTADGAYAITMRSNEQFTGNTVVKGRVNIANSSTATVTGNDFGTERFKVYNAAAATIKNNKINVLAFNDATVVKSTFADNELSAEAAAQLNSAAFKGGTWGGIDWTLTNDGVLTIAPTKGTPVADKNSGKTYEVGAWREAVRYNSKGDGVAIEGWPYTRSEVKKLIIEEGVISIGSFAAQSFTNLTGEVVIPSTVKYIGQEAFQKSTMTKLTFAPVPAGETGEELCIAQGAFKNLIIEEVSLPEDRPVHLHAWVFNNCLNLKTAYIPASVVSVHGTNHIDYFKDFNAHSNPTWTQSSEIFAYNKNMETVTFGSEEVRDMFYSKDNNTSDKDYIVATVGLTSYCKIADAIEAVNENGGTIKMHGNVTLADTWTIPAGKTITLDLNGKTISQEKACTASYEMINNKGNLTITGKGKLSFKDTGAGDPNFGWGSYTVRNEGNLVVENGTIEHKGAQASGTHCIMAIYQYCGSTTINGGTISTPNYRSARLWKGDMTINGGTFNGQVWVQAVDNTAKLTVNGGTFTPKGNDASAVFVTNNQYDVQLAVTNGTFNGKVGCSDAAKLAGAITGGSFSASAKENTAAALIATGLTFGEANADGYYAVVDDPATHYIATLEDLIAFRDEVNSGANYYAGVDVYLTADIDMAGENWVGIGSAAKDHGFMGNFDGQGYKIKNLTITDPALDSDGYAYAGLFGVTEGTDKNNQNTIKNLIIENVTINTTGKIAAAAIAYPYYTIVDNVKVCGDIKIQGGDYTAGVLAYTRRCVNASNLSIIGENNSFVKGAQVVGGVISDIQMNGGLTAVYSNFSAEGVTVSGTKNVGGISGIIATQTLNGATVKNVTLNSDNAGVGIVAGCLGGTSTISNVTYENVDGATALIGNTYDGTAIEAKIGDTYYATLEAALAAQGEAAVELLAPVTIAKDETVVLDLNGKTVSYTSAVAGEDMITNRGNLTITDSSDAKTGKLAYVNTDTTASNVTVSTISTEAGSTLVVDGGTIENKTVKADGSSIYSYAIDILTNGNLGDVNVTINGGKVYSDYMAIRQFNNGTACKNSLTINGGYIYGAKRAVQVHMDNNAAVTAISGGKIEAGEGGYAICNFAATSDLAVTGGEFIGAVYSARENFISGGIYDAEVYAGYCATGYMPNKNVDGTYGVVAVADAYASIDGVTYGSLKAAIKAAKAGETITLLQNVTENVTISKNLTIDGAGNTITGMITTDGKSLKVTIKNVNFDGNNKTINYAMRADDDLNLLVENCTASNYIYGFLYANKSNDKIVVKNVTVKNCPEYGAYLVAFNSASFENFTVEGNTKYGIAVANSGARTVNLKNVTFEDAEQPLHINELGTGKVTFKFSGINDMSKAEYYTSQYVNVVAAAQVGTNVCGSLQDAVVAANDGETVKVLADVNMTTANFVTQVDGYATLVNVAGKAVTIDLNGKKVTVNAADADLNGKAQNNMLMSVFHADPNGTLTLTDSSAEGTGTVELIANDAKVYGLIVSENAYDKSNPGKIIVNGGNYIADRLADSMIFADINEVITVNGGNFRLGNVATGNNGSPWIFNAAGQNQIHINVNGGTYNANVGKQHYRYEVNLGEGLATTNNGDGTWTVVPGVAAVGEELFGSIQEAIDAAQDGETVKLIADVALDTKKYTTQVDNLVVLFNVKGKAVTFDLNGKKIDVNASAANLGGKMLAGVFSADVEGDFTITDSSAEGTGAVNVAVNDAKVYSVFISENAGDKTKSGKMTVNAGNFTTVGKVANAMIYADTDKVVTINGGTFICDGVSASENYPWFVNTLGNNEMQVTVNGGTFNIDINHQYRPFEVFVPENLAVKANGDGTWTIVPAQAYVTELLGNYVNEPGSREHKVGYATVAEAIAAAEAGKTVTILAGDYTANLNVNKGITVQGEVDAEGNNLVTFNGKLNITADGATVKNININNPAGNAAYVGAKDVVVDGCKVVGNNGFRSCYTSGTVTFKNSYIKGGTYGIHFDGNAGGNIVIENCTVIGWTSFAGTIENVAISGTTFAEGNYNQLRLYQNATITDCTFNEKMNIDWGSSNKTAEFDNCSVENGGNLLDVIYIADIAEMGLEVTINGERVCVAAKVNDKYYLSLQAAIDAATEGQTVEIISDIALTEGVTVAADKNITIALNGKTITGTPAEAKAYAVITNKGTLTIEGEGAVICNHTLAGSTGYAVNTITNCGTLTIDGATIENKSTASNQIGYAIDNNSTSADAKVTVVSGKVVASGSLYYDGIRQFCNSTTAKNDVIVRGGEVSTIWMQNPSDGATKNTKDVKGSVTIEVGTVGVLSLEPSANFDAAVTGGHIGEVSYFQTAAGRDLKEFVTGGTFGTLIAEDPFLAYGYQVTNDAAPYKVEWTGRREVVTINDNGSVVEFANETDITVGTLTYKRNFGTAKNQSFYVPFEVPMSKIKDDFNVYYISNMHAYDKNEDAVADSLVLEAFKLPANAVLKANYPYIIRAKVANTEMNIELSEATLREAEENSIECSSVFLKFEIQGVYSRRVGPEYEGTYLLSGGTWKTMQADTNLNAFRLGMTITETGDSPYIIPAEAMRSIGIRVIGEENEDGTTTIYDVEAEAIEDMIFDLQGRRVLETEKGGIYIKGGKKFIAQ